MKSKENRVLSTLMISYLLCSWVLSYFDNEIRQWGLQNYRPIYPTIFRFFCILVDISLLICIIHYQILNQKKLSKSVHYVIGITIVLLTGFALFVSSRGFASPLEAYFVLLIVQVWMIYFKHRDEKEDQ